MAIQMGTTIEDIIFDLTENLGDKFRNAVIDQTGKLRGGFGVVLNKRLIPPSQMSQNAIHQNSNLSIIPLAGGG
ncbi:MAG: MoaD/ThiS family protein [Deltaproteobacteria bacterium]|nr:MoaD/ThiS family protein [Deltaproteobacteria bacterium]